ncbi:Tho complex subunit 7-domain-containing protein [Syncephalis fuscata]|nr:Tho complex subunit 7-domain-containing protein [Syncephalis fuscata]
MATLNPAIVLNRLVADERLLRRLLKRYAEFVKLCRADSSPTAMDVVPSGDERQLVQDAYLQVIYDIEQFRLFAVRQRLQLEASAEESRRYQQTAVTLADETKNAAEHVLELKKELDEARQERERKLEYDRLATKINQLPTRDTSHRNIHRLREEINELGNSQEKHADRVEMRRAHLRRILDCIAEMTAAIQAETDGDPSIDAAALEMADADIGTPNIDIDTQHNDTDGELNDRVASGPARSSQSHTVHHRHHPLRTAIEEDEEGQLLPKDSTDTSMDVDKVLLQ